jgi:hypothetical protein
VKVVKRAKAGNQCDQIWPNLVIEVLIKILILKVVTNLQVDRIFASFWQVDHFFESFFAS